MVFEAGHLPEGKLTGLVYSFILELESFKRLSDAMLDRQFLRTGETVWEYAPDGSAMKIWPRN